MSDFDELKRLLGIAAEMSERDSNDDEISALSDALDHACSMLHVDRETGATNDPFGFGELKFRLINEDGEEYDAFDNFTEAYDTLVQFPNDTIIVRYANAIEPDPEPEPDMVRLQVTVDVEADRNAWLSGELNLERLAVITLDEVEFVDAISAEVTEVE